MRVYLTDQSANLEDHLKDLITSKVSLFDKNTLPEKTSLVSVNVKKSVQDLNLDFLFDYKIFPVSIMAFKTQWEMEKRKMQMNDTIVQQVYIPPLKTFSQKIIFGVRINSIINTPLRKGFSYVTLEGHVEKGESVFTIEQNEEKIIFKIQTFSKPGNFLSKLAAPIFSLPYQNYCTQKSIAEC